MVLAIFCCRGLNNSRVYCFDLLCHLFTAVHPFVKEVRVDSHSSQLQGHTYICFSNLVQPPFSLNLSNSTMVQPTICGQSARVYLEYNHATDIPAREAGWTRFVCLSDTHSGTHWDNGGRMPRGDVLLHAGDLSSWGTVRKLQKTVDWLGNLEGYATKM